MVLRESLAHFSIFFGADSPIHTLQGSFSYRLSPELAVEPSPLDPNLLFTIDKKGDASLKGADSYGPPFLYLPTEARSPAKKPVMPQPRPQAKQQKPQQKPKQPQQQLLLQLPQQKKGKTPKEKSQPDDMISFKSPSSSKGNTPGLKGGRAPRRSFATSVDWMGIIHPPQVQFRLRFSTLTPSPPSLLQLWGKTMG